MDRKLYKNVKIRLIFVPISNDSNEYTVKYYVNKAYYLENHDDKFFIPRYIELGRFGEEVERTETYMENYREYPSRIKSECINKFTMIKGNGIFEFYGYFENMAKLNRTLARTLKPFIINTFLDAERIKSDKLVKNIENLRFV